MHLSPLLIEQEAPEEVIPQEASYFQSLQTWVVVCPKQAAKISLLLLLVDIAAQAPLLRLLTLEFLLRTQLAVAQVEWK